MTNNDRTITNSLQYKQWQRLGFATVSMDADGGEDFFHWTEKGRHFATYFQRKMVEFIVTGQVIKNSDFDVKSLTRFDKDGYALEDED